MTTIVYRDGVMAADSQVLDRSAVVGTVKKLYRRADGAVAGTCGSLEDWAPFMKWFKNPSGFDAPAALFDFEALVALPSGEVLWFGKSGRCTPYTAPFYAIGSGYQAALGALHAGASAERAAEIACLVDVDSGGPIIVEKVGAE